MKTQYGFKHLWQSSRLLTLLLLLAACCFPGTRLRAAEGEGLKAPLQDTFHTDGRGTPKLIFPATAESMVGNSREGADKFLQSRQAEFKLPVDLSNLELVRARESLLGTHYRYRQMLNGVPVEGAEVVVSISREGQVYQSYNNTYPAAAAPVLPKALIGQDRALDIAWNHLRVHGKLLGAPRAVLVYLPEKGGFRLAYKTLVAVQAPSGDWEHRIDALSGALLAVRDTRIIKNRQPEGLPKFADYNGPILPRIQATQEWEAAVKAAAAGSSSGVNKATVDGTGRVFDADPRTYLNNPALVDTSAASAFTTAYVTNTLRDITLLNGVYTLSGPYVTIVNWDPPATAPSTTVNGLWMFSRGNNAFNDAMTYFQIDKNQRYLQALGYVGGTGIQNVPIQTDSDGWNGADNSSYSPGANRLTFGHGGVDDNEDADVILHEYGHAITHDIVPTWGSGDAGAIGEGFGDYWGGSYSSSTVNGRVFHPEWAFSWDGHSADTWSGRMMNMTNLTYDPAHTYTDHETIGGIPNYSDQLWSAPLWAAFTTLTGTGYARTNIDKIIIESFFGVGGGPTMRDLAYATVSAANRLFPSGPYGTVFSEKFLNQNILPPTPVPNPSFVVPAGGETFTTGSVVQVTWNRQGAPAAAAARLEYSAGTVTSFSDSMESGVNGWTVTHNGGTLNWAQVTSVNHSPTHSWFATNQVTVTDQFLRSPLINVTAGAVLSFWHLYDLETQFDGGVVEISNNGTTWTDLGSLSTQNGYITTIAPNYLSSIAGRMAFTGSSGSFIQTLIPLSTYSGQNVYIRFRLASDDGVAFTGWWVDDVVVSKQWTTLGTTAAGASSYGWTAPMTPGTNYVVRIQQFAAGYSDSAWVQSSPFSLGATVPRPLIQSIGVTNSIATIRWSSVSGATYRVQYKSNVNDANWTNLTPDVVASGSTAVKTDQPVTTKRFYRVIVP